MNIVVAGVGLTPFGKFLDRSLRDLASEAAMAALADAGAATADIGMIFFGNAAAGFVTGQEMIRGETALRGTGLLGKPIVNVENACCSGSTAVHLAEIAVRAGQCDVALAIGAEKLAHADKTVSARALGGGVDVSEERRGGGSIFMEIYAEKTRRYMAETGARAADFAAIAVKSHWFAARNPDAQFRNEVTEEEVLGSRMIAEPLTLLMCSPIGDGAAAVVVASEAWARRHGADAVTIRASVLTTANDDGAMPYCAERALAEGWTASGLGPADIDVAEVHDASAAAELMLYERIGLCAPGEGAAFLRSGAPGPGGRVPVNPSGGLLSRGHPVGATGAAQIVELTRQLRGRSGARQREGARIALAENNGGTIGDDAAAAVVTILER